MNIPPTEIRTSFAATDCKWCAKTVSLLREDYGMPLLYAQEAALKEHVIGHVATKEYYGESAY